MDIKRNDIRATVKHSFTVEFAPEDEIYFESSKYQRGGKVAKYRATQITFVLQGEVDVRRPGDSADSVLEYLPGYGMNNRLTVRGEKIVKGEPNGNITIHDGYEVRNGRALIERVLADLGIDVVERFEVTTFKA